MLREENVLMVRYLIKFTKESSIKFIGHLDLMRTIQRMIRRSELPVKYSNGFNPHINMSIAQPLPVGVYSCGEYMDISFENEVSEDEIKSRLNENSPAGIKVLGVRKISDDPNKKVFKSMAEIRAARYIIKIKYNDISNINKDMKNILEMPEWRAIKKTKRGEKESDLKKFVKNIEYKVSGNTLVIDTTISCGSIENLSCSLLAQFIQKNTRNVNFDAFVDIMRKELYGIYKGKMMPLLEIVELY
jgi:radical SAM-linked protein